MSDPGAFGKFYVDYLAVWLLQHAAEHLAEQYSGNMTTLEARDNFASRATLLNLSVLTANDMIVGMVFAEHSPGATAHQERP
jgi:hypothetical protein